MLIRKGLDPARVLSLFDKGNKKTGYARPRKVKFKKVHATGKPLSDEENNAQRAENQQKIDNILDKIAKSGYSTLSKDEKEFLFKSSKKS